MNIKSESRMLNYLVKRIKAQKKLLVAYRVGGHPSSTTLDNLEDTKDWETVLENYRNRGE
ncbi:MAG TPA: hypothetical protein ENH85_06135 [Candidatus Scalindua sp.]|nr:hypothetical protein [Candidatus Scalindua sp.]